MAKKKAELAVVLISVDDFSDGRKAAENIENQTFKTCSAVRKEVRNIGIVLDIKGEVCFYRLTDFMDSCNAQAINLEHFWISYVYIEEKF